MKQAKMRPMKASTSKQYKVYLEFCLLQFPNTEEEMKKIANEFKNKWQFPNCLGAVDGKHIVILPLAVYYNYKSFHSVVLMAIANANYEFIYIDVCTNGRISDGGVILNTDFLKRLVRNS